ncbi:hypothetical protein ANTPLA_LOCUS6726 [Anthophora plagiata]
MTFIPHTEHLVKRGFKALNIVKYLRSTWWGSNPATLIILYKSFVRSVLDYGCFVFAPKHPKIFGKLERLQFSAIRLALGYRSSTPTNIILAESKIPLLIDRFKYLCYRFLSKTFSNNSPCAFQTIRGYYYTTFYKTCRSTNLFRQCILSFMRDSSIIESHHNFNIYSHDYSTVVTSIPFNDSFGHSLRSLENADDINRRINNLTSENNAIAIFTDGSKGSDSNCIGAAYFCPKLDQVSKKCINKRASIFTAECIAINDALNLAVNNNDRNFLLFSDALSVLSSLNSSKMDIRTNSYILNIKKLYNRFICENGTNSTIKFYWISSHIEIAGNERADQLAKEASQSGSLNISKIPFTDLYESFRKDMFYYTNSTIKAEGLYKGKTYFNKFFRENDRFPWFSHVKVPRSTIVTINRCRADHFHLSSSLARIGIVANPKCKCSTADETLNHVPWQCHIYNNQRSELVNKLVKEGFQLPMDVSLIIAKPNIKACLHMAAFFKNCNLNI